MKRGLRRRYARSTSSADRWSANTRAWWSRAEAVAPAETAEYRRAKRRGGKAAKLALARLKGAMR